MRVPDFNSKLNSDASSWLWETVERVQNTLLMSDAELADRLQIPAWKLEALRSKRAPVSAYSVLRLSVSLNLEFEHLIEGTIDYPRLAAQYFGKPTPLPEKYSFAAFSKKRTSINLLAFIEQFYGWRMRSRILRHFQMTEADFIDPNEWISLNFLSDLSAFLKDSSVTDQQFFQMGAFSYYTNRNDPLGAALKTFPTPGALYENVTSQFVGKHYEKNFLYRLVRLTSSSCTVEVVPNPEAQDKLKNKLLGNHELCMLRSGTFASISGYVGLPFSRVKKKTCIHAGFPSCIYLVIFQTEYI